MNSRERVVAALNHQEPDKVPIDLNGTTCTTITRNAYVKLREYLGLEKEPAPFISDLALGAVIPKDDILTLYGIDTRMVYDRNMNALDIQFESDGSFYDELGVRWRPASYYYDAVERPLTEAESVADLEKIDWNVAIDRDELQSICNYAKDLFYNTSYCLIADFNLFGPFGPFEGGCVLRGYDKFLMDFYANTDFAESLLNNLTDMFIQKIDAYLEDVGDLIQVVAFGDDVGMQSSTYVSPEMYRRYIKPLHKKIFDFTKTKTDAKIFLHSCGSVYDIIPDFIEEGVDILNPVQRSAAKMDIEVLKKEFGSDITFWGGGIDIQQQLPFFTNDQIEEEVKRTIDIMADGGGFVFFPTHNIQPDTSPEKIDCMFKAVMKYGGY